MDCDKVGKLILRLRREKGMTQLRLAEEMHISDKTVSKWERGLGCPDVSLLGELSAILGVNIEKILLGDLEQNDRDGGNMKKMKFYVCPQCGNTLAATGEAEPSCCGRRLEALAARPADADHAVRVQEVEDELYLTFAHEMRKDHFIRFIAAVGYDRMLLVRLYPEQDAQARIPKIPRAQIYVCCSRDGLWTADLEQEPVS